VLVGGPLAGIRTNTGIRIVAGLRKVGERLLTVAITGEDKACERVFPSASRRIISFGRHIINPK
jgi:hypothetical protein